MLAAREGQGPEGWTGHFLPVLAPWRVLD